MTGNPKKIQVHNSVRWGHFLKINVGVKVCIANHYKEEISKYTFVLW